MGLEALHPNQLPGGADAAGGPHFEEQGSQ